MTGHDCFCFINFSRPACTARCHLARKAAGVENGVSSMVAPRPQSSTYARPLKSVVYTVD